MTNSKENHDQDENTTFILNGNYKDFDKLLTLFESGELEKKLGISILELEAISKYQPKNSVEPSTDLSQWLENKFTEAEQTLWLTIEEIFGTRPLAFRDNLTQRAKQIQLGDLTIALTLDLKLRANTETRILLGVYPLGSQTKLPKNLITIIIDHNQETLVEISAPNYPDGIVQELFFEPEESFTVEINYDNFKHRENFVV